MTDLKDERTRAQLLGDITGRPATSVSLRRGKPVNTMVAIRKEKRDICLGMAAEMTPELFQDAYHMARDKNVAPSIRLDAIKFIASYGAGTAPPAPKDAEGNMILPNITIVAVGNHTDPNTIAANFQVIDYEDPEETDDAE